MPDERFEDRGKAEAFLQREGFKPSASGPPWRVRGVALDRAFLIGSGSGPVLMSIDTIVYQPGSVGHAALRNYRPTEG